MATNAEKEEQREKKARERRMAIRIASFSDNEMAIKLAADILKDHFGDVVERVGSLLMRRGGLSAQDIMRFLNEEKGVDQEPLRFPHVRNALLVLVQHNLVEPQPHPRAKTEELKAFAKVYYIGVDDVIARLRLPHFLEYCYWQYGELACELLSAAFRHGRVCARVAMEEARQAVQDASAHDLDAEFRKLVKDGLLLASEPYMKPPSPQDGTAHPPVPLQDSAASSGAEGAKRQRLDGGREAASSFAAPARPMGPQDATGESPGQIVPVAASKASPEQIVPAATSTGNIADTVFYYNQKILNLCLFKNLLCRLVEERIDSHAAKVVAALFAAVRPGKGDPMDADVEQVEVQAGYMNFEQVDSEMRSLGGHQPGRDPARERKMLKEMLDALSSPKGKDPPLLKRDTNRFQAESDEKVAMWKLEWESAKRLLVHQTLTQVIRDQFGIIGLRIFNLLVDQRPFQRLEEKYIFSTCMVRPEDGRDLLNEMCRRMIVHWQEVPKRPAAPEFSDLWLFYVDYSLVQKQVLWSVFQTILNLRVRFRVESARVQPQESRKNSLTKKELKALKEGRKIEDILERSFLVLDTAVLVFMVFRGHEMK